MTRLIAITGGSGAGKTTIARALAARLGAGARVIAEDDYYRCSTTIPGFDAATHNFDAPSAKDSALLAEHLALARAGEGFDKPLYDLVTHTRRPESERIEPAETIILEGILLLAFPELRPLYHLGIYIEADESVRLGRRMIRDVETRGRALRAVYHQFHHTVAPMHALHVAPQRAHADLVLVSTANDGESEAGAHAARIAQRIAARIAARA